MPWFPSKNQFRKKLSRFYRRRMYRRKGKGKPKGKVYKRGVPKKALTGPIDTALEKRMQKISKDTLKETLNPLVYRRFINWAYQDPTGTYPIPTFDYEANPGADVSFAGEVHEMSQIPLRLTQSAQVQTQIIQNGYRKGDQVKVYGISLGLRVIWDVFSSNQNDLYESNTLHFAIVKWRSPLNVVEASTGIPGPIKENSVVVVDGQQNAAQRAVLLFDQRPTVEHCLPLKPWGYSSRLDNPTTVIPAMGAGNATPLPENTAQRLGPYSNHTTIYRGKLFNKFQAGNDQPRVQKFTKYIKLKKPMRIQYNITQSNGARVQTPDKLFLVMRSQIPNIANVPFEPKVCGFYKLHYYD